jgi:hypothetical protein
MAAPSRGLISGKAAPDTLPDVSEYLVEPTRATDLTIADRPGRGLRTPRSPEYLSWRFGAHPTARYYRVDAHTSTAVVRPNVRSGRRELVLSDVFGPDPAKAVGAVHRRSRAAYVAGWFSARSPERRAAMRRGMIPIPAVKTLKLVAKPLRPLPVDVASLAAWDFASSDLELL